MIIRNFLALLIILKVLRCSQKRSVEVHHAVIFCYLRIERSGPQIKVELNTIITKMMEINQILCFCAITSLLMTFQKILFVHHF